MYLRDKKEVFSTPGGEGSIKNCQPHSPNLSFGPHYSPDSSFVRFAFDILLMGFISYKRALGNKQNKKSLAYSTYVHTYYLLYSLPVTSLYNSGISYRSYYIGGSREQLLLLAVRALRAAEKITEAFHCVYKLASHM